jgi:hypothetical protein
MKKQTLKIDYELGHHSWHERELHRKIPPWRGDLSPASYKERQNVSDEIFRANPSRSSEVVVCEVCQEYLAEAKLSNGTPFAVPAGVREMHAEFERSARTQSIRAIQRLFEGSSA